MYEQNIAMSRADEVTWPATVYNYDGTVMDITSCTFYFTAKEDTAFADARAVFQKSSADGITITDATNGEIEIAMAKTDTSHLPNRRVRLQYDLQMITSAGKPITVTRGILIVKDDVTLASA